MLWELATLELKVDSEVNADALFETEVTTLCSAEVGSLILASSEADICSISSSDWEIDALTEAWYSALVFSELPTEEVTEPSERSAVTEPTLVLVEFCAGVLLVVPAFVVVVPALVVPFVVAAMPWTVVVPAVVAAVAGVAALVPAGVAAGVTGVARAAGVLAAEVFAAGIVGTNGVLPTLGIWVAL